jgi:hypothetical protein
MKTIASLLLALGVGLAGPAAPATPSKVQQGLVTAGQVKFWTANGKHIPMCWHELHGFATPQAAAAAQAFVAQTIEDGWASLLGLKVTWTSCPTSGTERHVRTLLRSGDAKYNGNTVKPGMATLTSPRDRMKYVRPVSRLQKDPPGLLMGFPADWNQDEWTRGQFRSLILHEFGHILGFAHEQKSGEEGPGSTCPSEDFGNRVNIGPADHQSIMGFGDGYCEGSLGALTPQDVRSARLAYGTGRSGHADFNADGRADILWHNAATGEAQIWFMSGAQRIGRATVTSGDQPARIGPPFRIVASRDFNGDGKADILWHNGATGETQIWFMDGHRLADRATVALAESGAAMLVGLPWSIVATSDINRDGRSDIVWHNAATGETQVWLMDRHRIKDRVTVQDEHGRPMFVGAPWRIVGSNDMSYDGWADLVWHNAATGETQVWVMLGHRIVDRRTVLAENGRPFLVGLPYRIAGTDDYNQDGSADILWHNDTTGETQIWFMRKTRVARRATVDAVYDGEGIPLVGLPWRIAANLSPALPRTRPR